MSRLPSIEDCRDFLAGNHQPQNAIDRAQFAAMTPSQLRDRARRDMKALDDYKRNMDKLTADRLRIEKNAASRTAAPKPAAPAPAARPFIRDCTQNLVLCVRRNLFKGEQHAAALAELKARNVTVHKRGYSVTAKKSH